MILYSIVPAEVVFQGSLGKDEVKYFEAGYKGERVVVSQITDQSCSISRLLSTNPRVYLNPEFQPGRPIDSNDLRI